MRAYKISLGIQEKIIYIHPDVFNANPAIAKQYSLKDIVLAVHEKIAGSHVVIHRIDQLRQFNEASNAVEECGINLVVSTNQQVELVKIGNNFSSVSTVSLTEESAEPPIGIKKPHYPLSLQAAFEACESKYLELWDTYVKQYKNNAMEENLQCIDLLRKNLVAVEQMNSRRVEIVHAILETKGFRTPNENEHIKSIIEALNNYCSPEKEDIVILDSVEININELLKSISDFGSRQTFYNDDRGLIACLKKKYQGYLHNYKEDSLALEHNKKQLIKVLYAAACAFLEELKQNEPILSDEAVKVFNAIYRLVATITKTAGNQVQISSLDVAYENLKHMSIAQLIEHINASLVPSESLLMTLSSYVFKPVTTLANVTIGAVTNLAQYVTGGSATDSKPLMTPHEKALEKLREQMTSQQHHPFVMQDNKVVWNDKNEVSHMVDVVTLDEMRVAIQKDIMHINEKFHEIEINLQTLKLLRHKIANRELKLQLDALQNEILSLDKSIQKKKRFGSMLYEKLDEVVKTEFLSREEQLSCYSAERKVYEAAYNKACADSKLLAEMDKPGNIEILLGLVARDAIYIGNNLLELRAQSGELDKLIKDLEKSVLAKYKAEVVSKFEKVNRKLQSATAMLRDFKTILTELDTNHASEIAANQELAHRKRSIMEQIRQISGEERADNKIVALGERFAKMYRDLRGYKNEFDHIETITSAADIDVAEQRLRKFDEVATLAKKGLQTLQKAHTDFQVLKNDLQASQGLPPETKKSNESFLQRHLKKMSSAIGAITFMGVGAGVGFWVGSLFAIPTAGLSLILGPILGAVAGAIVGGLAGLGIGFAVEKYRSNRQSLLTPKPPMNPDDSSTTATVIGGSQHKVNGAMRVLPKKNAYHVTKNQPLDKDTKDACEALDALLAAVEANNTTIFPGVVESPPMQRTGIGMRGAVGGN